jgi:hypothetical protein
MSAECDEVIVIVVARLAALDSVANLQVEQLISDMRLDLRVGIVGRSPEG